LWNPVVGIVRRNYFFALRARSHPLREGDELIERVAPPIVEAHVRVFLAPSSSPWIAIAVYLVPASCGSSRITAVKSGTPAEYFGQ
jgi:hypothetical protein